MSGRIMKASELVERLQTLMAEHGDLEVYSVCDWAIVGDARYELMEYATGILGQPHFLLEQ
jgi:hypothetical protein